MKQYAKGEGGGEGKEQPLMAGGINPNKSGVRGRGIN